MLKQIYKKKLENKNYEVFQFLSDNKEIYYLTVDKKADINCIALDKNVFINQLVNSKLDKKVIDEIVISVKKITE